MESWPLFFSWLLRIGRTGLQLAPVLNTSLLVMGPGTLCSIAFTRCYKYFVILVTRDTRGQMMSSRHLVIVHAFTFSLEACVDAVAIPETTFMLFSFHPLLDGKHCHQRRFISADCSWPQVASDGDGGETNANFISLADNHLTDAGFDTLHFLLLVFMTADFASQPLWF